MQWIHTSITHVNDTLTPRFIPTFHLHRLAFCVEEMLHKITATTGTNFQLDNFMTHYSILLSHCSILFLSNNLTCYLLTTVNNSSTHPA